MTPKEALDSVKNFNNQDFKVKAQGTISGALIGLVGGVMIAYYKDYNKFVSGLVGLLAGATVSNIFITKK